MYFEVESSIIEEAAAGDIYSFEKIVEIYEKTVFNVCYRFFNNTEDAQDVAQEVFIKIYRNLDKFNYKCAFSTWIHKIAVNSCIDHSRRRKTEPQTMPIEETHLPSAAESPADTVIANEAADNIAEAICRLRQEYKTVIILRDIKGFSYQEISEITGVNAGTVKSRISRAREAIRNILVNDFRFSGGSIKNPSASDGGLKEAVK